MHDFYSVLLMMAAAICIGHVVIIWRRPFPITRSVTAFLLGMGWWCFAYALHWSHAPRPYPAFWIELTYLGVVVVPTSFFIFALRQTGQDGWLTHRWLLLFTIEPILTILLLWTDSLHGFFYGSHRPVGGAMLQGGPGFWFNVIYSYALLFLATGLLVQYYRRAGDFYRGQTRVILAGAALPWLVNALMLSGVELLPALDLTPIAFTLTGLAFAYGVRHYRLLDVLPIARDALIETMADGVIVVDAGNRLLDINPAGQTMLRLAGTPPIGQSIEPLLTQWQSLVERFRDIQAGQFQVEIGGRTPQFIDLLIVPVQDGRGRARGRLLVLRDISPLKRTEQELRAANRQLEQRIGEVERLQSELRQQANRDPLTTLYNRRYMTGALAEEIEKATFTGGPVSLLLIDLDGLKHINDRHGHAAGDWVLQQFGEIVAVISGEEGIACRYGGDEFVVILPGANAETARQRAEALRATLVGTALPYGGQPLHATISAGVATFPTHGETAEELLNNADRALYAAKERGRNRVESYGMAGFPAAWGVPGSLPGNH